MLTLIVGLNTGELLFVVVAGAKLCTDGRMLGLNNPAGFGVRFAGAKKLLVSGFVGVAGLPREPKALDGAMSIELDGDA